MRWPSFSRRHFWASTPPEYLSFSNPPVLRVRQYGVMLFSPLSRCSSAALAAIQLKMPGVRGQAMVPPCRFAMASRMAFMVVSLPWGDLPHKFVPFNWRRDNDGATAPQVVLVFRYDFNFGVAFVVI